MICLFTGVWENSLEAFVEGIVEDCDAHIGKDGGSTPSHWPQTGRIYIMWLVAVDFSHVIDHIHCSCNIWCRSQCMLPGYTPIWCSSS